VYREANQFALEVKKLLQHAGLKATKSLGQHFLADIRYLTAIISAAEVTADDTIIEIGPGLGVLTAELAKKAGKVVAIEVDGKLVLFLRKRLSLYSNIELVHADILKTGLSQLLCGQNSYKVVANLPYYITSPILHYFIKAISRPSLMVVMIQKEVAEAITGNARKMTAFGIGLHVYSKPSIVTYVPAQSFYPPPKVDSAIVRFDFLPAPAVSVTDVDGFLKFVRYGFASPRKQLRNSLAQGLNVKPVWVDSLLDRAGIESRRRPETLDLYEWERLYALVSTEREEIFQ
jgi:16S rRNA (adenine1518-N6/adenine1519-N6)-dimethyltransferase